MIAAYLHHHRETGELHQLSREGYNVYQLFTHDSYQLSTVHRQQGADQENFRQLLARASQGGLTLEDWQLLLTREES